jgi:hypothetical protein
LDTTPNLSTLTGTTISKVITTKSPALVSNVKKQFAQNNDAFTSQHQSLLNQLAQLSGQKAAYTGGNATAAAQPYLDQANQLASTVGKFNYTPINYQTQAYNAPDLSKYIVNPGATPTFNGQSQSNDYTSPYLQALLGKNSNRQPKRSSP